MRKSGYSEEQVTGFLHQAEVGVLVQDLCRKGGFIQRSYVVQLTHEVRRLQVPDASSLAGLLVAAIAVLP